jgi:hypothetical protein
VLLCMDRSSLVGGEVDLCKQAKAGARTRAGHNTLRRGDRPRGGDPRTVGLRLARRQGGRAWRPSCVAAWEAQVEDAGTRRGLSRRISEAGGSRMQVLLGEGRTGSAAPKGGHRRRQGGVGPVVRQGLPRWRERGWADRWLLGMSADCG